MKQKETMLNSLSDKNKITWSELSAEEVGDEHLSTSIDTPLKSECL